MSGFSTREQALEAAQDTELDELPDLLGLGEAPRIGAFKKQQFDFVYKGGKHPDIGGDIIRIDKGGGGQPKGIGVFNGLGQSRPGFFKATGSGQVA